MCVRSCGICRKIAGRGRPGATSPRSFEQAAAGADPVDVDVALRLALSLEGVDYRAKGL